jgi:hypothetical protein
MAGKELGRHGVLGDQWPATLAAQRQVDVHKSGDLGRAA